MKKQIKKGSKGNTQHQPTFPLQEPSHLSSNASKFPITINQEFMYQKIQSLNTNLHQNTLETRISIDKFRQSDKKNSGVFILSNDQIRDLVIANKQMQGQEIPNKDQSKEQADKQNQKEANRTIVIIQQPSKEEP